MRLGRLLPKASRRRAFLAGGAVVLLAATAEWFLAPDAPVKRKQLIGYLHAGLGQSDLIVAAFRRGLGEQDFEEGRNVEIAYRYAEQHRDRLPALAGELIARGVDVIATFDLLAAKAAKAATSSIPIVFYVSTDPVELGLVESYSRPGGNLTGLSDQPQSLAAKRLELLDELVPKSMAIGYLTLRAARAESERGLRPVAQKLGREIVFADATTDAEIDDAFADLARQGVGGLAVVLFPFFSARRQQIVALAGKYRMPAVYPWRGYAESGGLLSYGVDLAAFQPQFGVYVGRILKGERPAELPVLTPAKYELVVNLKAARAQDIALPDSLLSRATEVIE